MYKLKEVCYVTPSIPAIQFFYGKVIISRKYLKRFLCQEHYVYFATLVVGIHYNQQFLLDSRKYKGYVYLRKAI